MKTDIKTWGGRALLAFVLVTVGFALGRNTAPTGSAPDPGGTVDVVPHDAAQDKVVVYAVHTSFRCASCNQIEAMAQELVEGEFAAEVAAGILEFQSLNIMREVGFAERYGISASTLVVVRFADGQEAGFDRLDEVWTRLNNRESFMAYVREHVQAHLARLRGEPVS